MSSESQKLDPRIEMPMCRYVDDQFAQYFEGESGINRRNMVSYICIILNTNMYYIAIVKMFIIE